MHYRLLKYLINTIKASWQKSAVSNCPPPISWIPREGPLRQLRGLSTPGCHSLAPGYHQAPLTVYKFPFRENRRAQQNQSTDQAGVKYQESWHLSEQNREKQKRPEKVKTREQPRLARAEVLLRKLKARCSTGTAWDADLWTREGHSSPPAWRQGRAGHLVQVRRLRPETSSWSRASPGTASSFPLPLSQSLVQFWKTSGNPPALLIWRMPGISDLLPS